MPVLNITRHDFLLRTEVTHFLSLVSHTDEAALVFRDDIDLHSWHAEGKLALTLVDHNTLPRGDATLDAAVKEIIDHHSNGRLADDEREICMTIETVGSCCTLVAEKMLAENPEGIDTNIAKLLLGKYSLDPPQKVSSFWCPMASPQTRPSVFLIFFVFAMKRCCNCSQNCWINWNSAVLCFKCFTYYEACIQYVYHVFPCWQKYNYQKKKKKKHIIPLILNQTYDQKPETFLLQSKMFLAFSVLHVLFMGISFDDNF